MSIYHETYNSPNFGYGGKGNPGRHGHKIIGAGVHITGGEWESNRNWILNPASNASYNCVIKRDGTRAQFVAESNPAYSHGRINKATWPLLKTGVNPNIYTLSVARVGSNQNLWTPEQMESTLEILKYWSEKYNFPLARPHVFGHFEIDAAGRWYCPGKPFFDELVRRMATYSAPAVPVPPSGPLPKINRRIGVMVNGKMTAEPGYLIGNATYVRAAYVVGLVKGRTTGHGDHIRIEVTP